MNSAWPRVDLKAVFFDWSGTLADDLGPVVEATNRVLGHHGVGPLDRDAFKAKFRLPYAEFYEEMLPGVQLDELESIFRESHAASAEPVLLLPGAEELLLWCRRKGLRIFLCSSVHEEGWRQQAGELGVESYFEAAHTGVRNKVEALPELLERHGLTAGEAVFVGDMVHDIDAARTHGVTSLGLTHGYEPRERLEQAGADFVCDSLGEVCGLLEALLRTGGEPQVANAEDRAEGGDSLAILGLRLATRLGVPAAERAQLQEIELDLVFQARQRELATGEDGAEPVVDYAQVAATLEAEAAARPRRLLETLGHDLAARVLADFAVVRVELRLRKFILPNTRAVELHLVRMD